MFKTIRFFVLTLLCLSSSLVRSQQSFRFDHITVKDGLSQNSVNCIFQDKQGFMWFGTQDGLNKYDGYNFTHYRSDLGNGNSLSDNFILSIAEDENGNIWCTTRDGVNRINPKTGAITRFFEDTLSNSNQAYGVFIFKGIITILFPEHRYDLPVTYGANNENIQLSENDDVGKVENKEHYYKKSRSDYGWILYVGESAIAIRDTVYQLDTNQSAHWNVTDALLSEPDESVWVGNDKGLFYIDSKTQELQQLLKDVRVMSIERDDFGRVWVGSSNGIYIYKNGRVIHRIQRNDEQNWGLSYDFIQTIYKDRSGLMWVGSPNAGINIYDANKEKFKFLNQSHGIGGKIIWSIYQTSSGDYLMGTNNGIYQVELKPGKAMTSSQFAHQSVDTIYKIFTGHDVLSNNRVISMSDNEQYLYIGTSEKGMYKVNKVTNEISKVDLGLGHENETITNIKVVNDQLWVTSFHGYFLLNLNGEVMQKFPNEAKNSVPSTYFLAAHLSSSGSMYLGTNMGFSEHRPPNQAFTNYIYDKTSKGGVNFQFVSGFVEQADEGLWIATFGGGLNFMDKQGKFSYYTEQQGLANNVISALVKDEAGRLWMSTNKGISCFNPEQELFSNFTTKEGVIFNEFALNSFYKNNIGEMFFGTADGLVILNPKAFFSDTIKQWAPVITQIEVNYKSDPSVLTANNHIDLYYRDKTISFEISALNFRNPNGVKYQYKLVGFNESWIETDAGNRLIHYSNLPYGDYTLKIKASNELGEYSAEAREITIAVHPPFWLTWWFIFLEIAVVVFLIIVVVRYLAQRKLKEQLRQAEVQRKIHEERLRISRDLHDNIGSQLTFIISSVDNIKFMFKEADDKLKNKLAGIGDFTRTTITQLRDTIWALNKDELTFEELESRLMNYLDNAKLANDKIQFKFTSDVQTAFTLNPIQGVCVYRIVQEAMNNSLKYAAATNIRVHATESDREIIIQVSDDGIGFELAEITPGNGLENMNNRAKTMDAALSISSNLEKGTTITLKIDKRKLHK